MLDFLFNQNLKTKKMTRKLIPMREFTLEMYEQIDCVHKFQDVVYKWAKFLGQKPELWMFIPCDEEGNVLEEPLHYAEFTRYETNKYQQALSRVIFEGFKLHFEYGKSWAVKGQGRVIRSFDLNTLEDLTHYDLIVKFEI
jgi:hypothetical protein